MKISYFLASDDCLPNLNSSINEIIIGAREYSRFGTFSLEQALKKGRRLKERGFRTVFCWDIISTQLKSIPLEKSLKDADLSSFDAVRVLDLGAAKFVFENLNLPLQILCEAGFNNLMALKGLEHYFDQKLERIILSNELPKAKVKLYKQSLKTPLEVYGLGPLLIYYTPRKLLTREKLSEEFANVTALASSEESPHKDFRILENNHGTYMFHPKNICLLERKDEIESLGVDYLHLNLSDDPKLLPSVLQLTEKQISVEEFKNRTSVGHIRGYFDVNKSTKQFIHLKNDNLIRDDDQFVGKILEVKKGKYLALKILGNDIKLNLGQSLTIKTPEGREKELTLTKIETISGDQVSETNLINTVYLINTLSGISPQSSVYFCKNIEK